MAGRSIPSRCNFAGYFRQLIGRGDLGDQQGLAKLDSMFRPGVERFLFKACGDRWLADELTNQTLLRAYQSLSSFRGRTQGQFQSFLFRIGANLLRDYYRREPHRFVSLAEGEHHRYSGCADCSDYSSSEGMERSRVTIFTRSAR